MIEFEEHKLSNGLKLIWHEDKSTPLVVVNILYKVGSRDEDPEHTGLAHLFEHLMFSGSKNVPEYDKTLQKIGAENNAFTNSDFTNYYIILNAKNIETALWVESDRMQSLSLDHEALKVQKSVVVEEFKQRYLNIPYGDAMLVLRPLAYKLHSYRWPTIGKDISHIEKTTLDVASDFYKKFYSPENAIITIAGNISKKLAYELVSKWFEDIQPFNGITKNRLTEPKQTNKRFQEVKRKVPLNSIYKAYHMPERGDSTYYAADILSDILGRGKASRLHQNLVKKNQLFNNINAHILGSADPGLLVISGKINPRVDMKEADKLIDEEIESFKNNLEDYEVSKAIHLAESSYYFANVELLNRAVSLSVANAIGNTNLVNEELTLLLKLGKEDILKIAYNILIDSNCNTLFYRTNQ